MKVIVSCQHCIRQYEVESIMHGKLGRCDACKAYFTISVAQPAPPGEAINFTDPIEPNYVYFHEAVATFAGNIRSMFELAGEAFTPENASRFARTIPLAEYELREPGCLRNYFNTIRFLSLSRCRGRAEESRHRQLSDYFLWHFLNRPRGAQMMLVGAYIGSLSVEFDTPRPAGRAAGSGSAHPFGSLMRLLRP